MSHPSNLTLRSLVATTLVAAAAVAPGYTNAQQQPSTTARPADNPPIAQGWIDIATYSSPGMPSGMAGMMMGGGGSPMSSMFGGGKNDGNVFGNARHGGGAGSYVDVTLRTSRNPTLPEAIQTVPAGTKLAPTLQLKVLPQSKPVVGDDDTTEPAEEPMKARIKLYWGCGTTIRSGQPNVLDLSTATTAQLAEIFTGRRATQRGTHAAPGRPVWPNLQDKRMVPAGSSFAGAHAFTGEGVPESFKFTLPAAQDIMPPIALQQTQAAGVTQLRWQSTPHARGYFIAAMGGKGDDTSGAAEMTLWTSSEVPDSGLGLVDYQTNKSVDQWLKEKVLLTPATTSCDVPAGIFGEGENSGAMLRMIAYGTELNLAHPPRPTDPKLAWEPDWALKVRVKSVASAMLGMPTMEEAGATGEDGSAAGGEGSANDGAAAPEEPKKKKKFGLKDALDAVKDSVPLPN